MVLANKVIYQNGAIREFEKPEVCEAIKVANENRWTVALTPTEWDEREARLKKEYEENTKAPGPGGEQPNEGNPALSESASQFNDALLDEQAKKIAELTEEKERLEDKITIFNIFKKRNDEAYRRQIRSLDKEISKLNGIIHDKNAVLSDVAEELRLSKIREKNLTEVCQKYMKDVEDLREQLANKVVDKIDAQALKSAESALAYKDEVIETLDKELAEAKHELSSLKRPFRPDSTEAVVLFTDAYAKAVMDNLPCTEWKNDGKEVSATYILENGKKSKIALDFTGDEIIFSRTDLDKTIKDSLYSYKDKQLAEKDEVIADLDNELAATKKALEEKTKLVEIVRNGSKEYCDYGVAANEFIKDLAHLYVLASNNGNINGEMLERCKNYQTYGFPANCNRETKKEINDIARGKTKVVGVDIAEEGADHSGVTVLCGKDCIDDIIKKMK